MLPHRHRVLCADDYAMTAGVSRSIEQLAAANKLSATSAMVTMPPWAEDAPRIRELRGHLAVGLHLNLTVGAPAATARSLAPAGTFLTLQPLLRAALTRQLNPDDVRSEIRCQLDLFEQRLGHAPDHVDGHQHVHVLPTIRSILLDELAARYRDRPPLVRDPAEAIPQIAMKSPARIKALTVRALAAGLRRQLADRRLPNNTAFSGFSAFDTERPFETEIIAALNRRTDRSMLKIVMCHPGFPDAELAALDPVVARRRQEHDVLMSLSPPDAVIWHPSDTSANRPVPDWRAMMTGAMA